MTNCYCSSSDFDFKSFQEDCLTVANERSKNGVDKDFLKHCAGEVLEAEEAEIRFNYISSSESNKKALALELADIVICAADCAETNGIDLAEALIEKFEILKARAEGKGDKF